MPYLARLVAAVCAPTMTIVGRVIDSTDDRRDRARLSELNRLRLQFEGPEPLSGSCPSAERVSTTGQEVAE